MRPPNRTWFLTWSILLGGLFTARAADIDPAHPDNDLYQALLRDGATLAGKQIRFPAPSFHDDDTPAVEHAALVKLAGSERALKDLVYNAPPAPFIIKIRDVETPDRTSIRVVDTWFVIYTDLEKLDPTRLSQSREDGKPVSAGGMTFVSRLLNDDDLKERKIARVHPHLEWYTHNTGDLLEEVHFETTDRALGSRSKASWVFASRTDPRFDDDPKYPNRWWGSKPPGKPQPFAGDASTTRIGRLVSVPGALMVEAHFAFAEPYGWFKGEPVLRSKISLVAEKQIRDLRTALLKEPQEARP